MYQLQQYVYSYYNSIKKTIHHVVNISSTKVELFAIRYVINQAIQISKVFHIIIITNAIHLVKRIFDSTIHPYQLQSIAIDQDLRAFFNKYAQNSINFWDCSNNTKQYYHILVDKETKKNSTLFLSSYHMLSLPILKILFHGSAIIIKSTKTSLSSMMAIFL